MLAGYLGYNPIVIASVAKQSSVKFYVSWIASSITPRNDASQDQMRKFDKIWNIIFEA